MYNDSFGGGGGGEGEGGKCALSDRFKNHRFKDLCPPPPPDQRPLFEEHKDTQPKESME